MAFFLADTIANKLHLQKVSDFVLSPGAQPTKVLLIQLPIFSLLFLKQKPHCDFSTGINCAVCCQGFNLHWNLVAVSGCCLCARQQRCSILCQALPVPQLWGPTVSSGQQKLLQSWQGDHAMEQKRYGSCVLTLLYCSHFGLADFGYCVGFVFNLHSLINPEGSH